jgi:magnesium chelatase family protein
MAKIAYHEMSDHAYPCQWIITEMTCGTADARLRFSVTHYQKRISEPLLDRIDIQIHVRRVEHARQIQNERFKDSDVHANADMRPADVGTFCLLKPEGERLMRAAMSQMNLTARAYHRVLKLARTIADLAGASSIELPHLAEALNYRTKMDLM